MDKIHYTSDNLDILKQTITDCFEIMDNNRIDNNYYYESLWDFMAGNSNIRELFNEYGLSKYVFTWNCFKILNRIKDSSDEDLLDNFENEVNLIFLKYKNYQKERINVVIYTNIPYKFKNNNKLLDTLSYFGLEIFNIDDYNFETEESISQDTINKFKNSKFLMLQYSNLARDYEFVKNQSLKTVYSFFGYITYIHKYNKSTEKWHINEITLDNRVTDLQINALIATNYNYEIFDIDRQYDVIETAIKLDKSKIINFNNLIPVKHTLLESIYSSENTKLLNSLFEYLNLYYISANETIIENSFRKLWSLSERIIKDIFGHNIGFMKVGEYMETILYKYGYKKYFVQRIDFLKDKRHDLVHENIHGDITQFDQTVVKIIAENLIRFLIDYFEQVNDVPDYKQFY
ncbi:hypothetical protein [Methanobrevibacter gottschalkii]|uniref:hypothetical protein n=1 Tax=Methanobrevibacter gottschalkii TaxID=190974 RepID=UPI0026F3744D|nr:hypothetical protein [Methanobrevibacter gottschalkii]